MTDTPNVPDYLAPIAGARAWRLAPNLWAKMGGYLWSHFMNDWWVDGEEKVAVCDEGHEAPAEGCKCGVYAWLSPKHMERNGYTPRSHEHISGVIAAPPSRSYPPLILTSRYAPAHPRGASCMVCRVGATARRNSRHRRPTQWECQQ